MMDVGCIKTETRLIAMEIQFGKTVIFGNTNWSWPVLSWPYDVDGESQSKT